MRALLQSIIDQLDDIIARRKEASEPVVINVPPTPPNSMFDVDITKEMRKIERHPSHEYIREHGIAGAVTGIRYWPDIDDLSVFRARLARYLSVTP